MCNYYPNTMMLLNVVTTSYTDFIRSSLAMCKTDNKFRIQPIRAPGLLKFNDKPRASMKSCIDADLNLVCLLSIIFSLLVTSFNIKEYFSHCQAMLTGIHLEMLTSIHLTAELWGNVQVHSPNCLIVSQGSHPFIWLGLCLTMLAGICMAVIGSQCFQESVCMSMVSQRIHI